MLTTSHPQTIDTNSPYLAKFCFGLGIQLKRVEVIPDDEEDIIEAVRRMSARYDFVVTSGGIGPTSVPLHPVPISPRPNWIANCPLRTPTYTPTNTEYSQQTR